MDIARILDKANVKEFIAIAGGMVASNFVRDFAGKFHVDPRIRDAGIALGALGVTWFINDQAEKRPDMAELLGLVGLATTTIGAKPIADRVQIEIAKATSRPVVVARGKDVSEVPVTMKKKPAVGLSVGR